MRKKIKISINILFIVGIICIFFPVFKNTITLSSFQSSTVNFTNTIPKLKKNESIRIPTYKDYLENNPNKVGEAIGEIEIPSQNIKLPIFAGLQNNQMLYGVGSMYPERNIKNENIVLLGHHLGVENLLLGKLKNVNLYDSITVTYLGNILEYKIVKKNTILETKLDILENDEKPKLTLITCEKPTITNKRIVAVAELINEEKKQNKQKKTEIKYSKMIRRDIVQYSIIPIFFMLIVLTTGSYIIWRYL